MEISNVQTIFCFKPKDRQRSRHVWNWDIQKTKRLLFVAMTTAEWNAWAIFCNIFDDCTKTFVLKKKNGKSLDFCPKKCKIQNSQTKTKNTKQKKFEKLVIIPSNTLFQFISRWKFSFHLIQSHLHHKLYFVLHQLQTKFIDHSSTKAMFSFGKKFFLSQKIFSLFLFFFFAMLRYVKCFVG